MQVPIEALPADSPPHHQAAPPVLDAGPPEHNSRHRKNRQQDTAHAVYKPSGISAQQIVVQIQKPRDRSHSERNRFTDIHSGKRIEEPVQRVVGALEPYFGRGVRLFGPEEIGHDVAWVLSARSFPDRLVGEWRTGASHDNRTACKSARQLRTKNKRTSCDANDDDVNAGGDTRPKMDLKESLPRPHALRLTKQMLPETHCVGLYLRSRDC